MREIRVYNVVLYNVKREGDYLALYYAYENGQSGRYLCFIKNNKHYQEILKVLFDTVEKDVDFEDEPQNRNLQAVKVKCLLVLEDSDTRKAQHLAIGNPSTKLGCYLRTGEICDISEF